MIYRNLKKLRYLVFSLIVLNISVLVIFPLVFSKVVQPSIIRLVTNRNEQRAVQIANYLLSNSGNFENNSMAHTQISKAVKSFNLYKVKWFNSDGYVTFSTDSLDIGMRNTSDYFEKIIAQGKTYSQYVHKDDLTVEGKEFKVDLIETYVPVMYNNSFIGTFEIYHIVTDELAQSMHILDNATAIFISIAVAMLLILSIILLFFIKVESNITFNIQSQDIDLNKFSDYKKPLRILIFVICAIAFTEFSLMKVLDNFELESASEAWLDTTLLTLILTPLLYFWIFKPLLSTIRTLNSREKQLQDATREAQKANQSKSRFLANMTHEIRTPMNAVLGMSHILERTSLDEEQKESIETILSSGEVLLSVVNNVLDVSKIESGKLQLEKTEFDLPIIIDQSFHILKVIAEEKGLELHISFDPNIAKRVIGDPMRLKQILINLINNAIKFTKEGTVALQLELVEKDQTTEKILFSICDTGVGIPQKIRKEIFSPFTQADDSTAREFGGTGLGLTISEQFVKMMGGSITISASSDWATIISFQVSFPIVQESREALPIASLQGKNCYLITDSQIKSNSLEKTLLSLGMQVTVFEDNFKDLAHIVKKLNALTQPDIIIVENNATCDSCICQQGLLQKVSWGSSVASLVIPGHCKRGGAAICHHEGYQGYLGKPVQTEELQNTISLLLGASLTPKEQKQILTRYTVQEELKKKIKIAVVDDNPTNLRVACRSLKKMGYNPVSYNGGEEIIDDFLQNKPEIIFMDIHMPVLDGIQTTSIIREMEQKQNLPPTVIYALTAAVIELDEEKELSEAQFDGVVAKPFNLETLQSVIASAVHKRQ